MEDIFTSIVDYLKNLIPDLLIALLILIVSFYLAGVLARAVRRALTLRKVPEGAIQLVGGLTRVSIIAIGIIVALQSFVDVVTFLSGLGILALTVGFALQDVMKNFASGVILVIQQPFRVEEFVNVSGFDGTIIRIDLRSTEIRSVDGRVIILPNADILSKPIINYTRAARRRVDLLIGLRYDTDTEAMRKIVLEVVGNVPGAVPVPAPEIGFSNFGNFAFELNANFWIDTKQTNPGAAKDAALSAIKSAMLKQGIEFPYPIKN
jgi:small conductance mechanosensitive channel